MSQFIRGLTQEIYGEYADPLQFFSLVLQNGKYHGVVQNCG